MKTDNKKININTCKNVKKNKIQLRIKNELYTKTKLKSNWKMYEKKKGTDLLNIYTYSKK